MNEIIIIALCGLLVFIVGLPIVKWFDKAKKEMEEEDRQNGDGTN